MSTSSFSNGSSSSSDDLVSSSSDENILGDMGRNDLIIFQMMATMTSNSNDLFISNEIEGGAWGNMWIQPWEFACFGYYTSHVDIIKGFDKLYIGGI
jgi:hypothetical protein